MQEFLQIVLNKTKLTLCLFGLFAFVAFSQQTADISLELSVEPSMTMYPGQRGTIVFTISNSGDYSQSLWGNAVQSSQSHGENGYSQIIFDYAFEDSKPCSFVFDFQPTELRNPGAPARIISSSPNSINICRLSFSIPKNVRGDHVLFNYKFLGNIPDPNLNNNTASVRINIQPRTVGISTLSLWGLLVLVLGLLLLVKYRRKILF